MTSVGDRVHDILLAMGKYIHPDWKVCTIGGGNFDTDIIISDKIVISVTSVGSTLMYGDRRINYNDNEKGADNVSAFLHMDPAYQTFINTVELKKLRKQVNKHHRFLSEQIEFSPNGVQASLLKDDFEKLSLDQKSD